MAASWVSCLNSYLCSPSTLKRVFQTDLKGGNLYSKASTVSSKTVVKQRFLSARCMWRLRAWEWRLVLGRKSIVLLLGYLTVFWTCDLAQYSKWYDLFKLGLSLQRFWSCWNIHIFEVYLKFISTSMALVCLKHGLNPFRHTFNQFLTCCH